MNNNSLLSVEGWFVSLKYRIGEMQIYLADEIVFTSVLCDGVSGTSC